MPRQDGYPRDLQGRAVVGHPRHRPTRARHADELPVVLDADTDHVAPWRWEVAVDLGDPGHGPALGQRDEAHGATPPTAGEP